MIHGRRDASRKCISFVLPLLKKKVWIGVVSDNTGKIYKSKTTGISATFILHRTDTYHVFVQNHSRAGVREMGYYIK